MKNCTNSVLAKGYCSKHYQRLRKYGDASKGKTRYEWLIENIPDADECVEWPYGKNSAGYGTLKHKNRCWLVTHVVLELTGHPRKGDDLACHTCDNPPCYNPRHLYWGDYFRNAADRNERGRTFKTVPDEVVTEVRRRVEQGESQSDVARDLNLGTGYVSNVVNGKYRPEPLR